MADINDPSEEAAIAASIDRFDPHHIWDHEDRGRFRVAWAAGRDWERGKAAQELIATGED